MKPFDSRMLIIQALSEARMAILRLRSMSMLANEYGMDSSMISRLKFVTSLLEGIAGEMEDWLKTPRLAPGRILALMHLVSLAQQRANGIHPEVDLALSQVSSSLAHVYSLASEGDYSYVPDTSLIDSLLLQARRAAEEQGDAAS
ncbi:MAG: hypothetical protein F7C08_02210 [Desulfurococcales archaeon]|nr:hypothetical protein [Desulfurococcales archaeon]MCE4605332.1 hypothetical protein [Desulfurococcales archaeon]